MATATSEIINLLKDYYPNEVHKGFIFDELSHLGQMPDTISRECRKLAETGKIQRIKSGKSVAYRWKPTDPDLDLSEWRDKKVSKQEGFL